MKPCFLIPILVLCGGPLVAQKPASTPAPAPPAAATQVHSSKLGFSYSVPSDWEVVDNQATLSTAKQQAGQNTTSEDEKKGLACVELDLTARHGAPPSVMVEVALPFSCFGKEMAESDLPGFAAGASEGLKQSFDIGDPVYGAYSLGGHSMWIERAKGAPKGHPELPYTVEIACSLLKKAAVCWMTMAADDTALRTFEHGAVTLDGEAPIALVPATAFDRKQS